MNLTTKLLIALHFFIMTALSYGQTSPSVAAKIEKKDLEGLVTLEAIATNSSTVFYSLTYQLLAVKESKTGNLSSNQQSGKFTLQPNETKKLSEISLNVDTKDALKVYLFIRDEKNYTVAQDSLIYNNQIQSLEKKNLKKKTSNFAE